MTGLPFHILTDYKPIPSTLRWNEEHLLVRTDDCQDVAKRLKETRFILVLQIAITCYKFSWGGVLSAAAEHRVRPSLSLCVPSVWPAALSPLPVPGGSRAFGHIAP